MIPNHVLNDLAPTDRIAVLSHGGETRFLVHPASDDVGTIRAYAEHTGSQVLTTHMRDHAAIREFVATREPDLGGEG